MNENIHGETTASEPQDRVTELIEQQTAISEVLRAIASSPHDLQPIFDAILDSATRLCRADMGSLRLFEESRLRLVAVRGDPFVVNQARSSFPVLDKESFLGRLATNRSPTHVPNLTALEGDHRDDLWVTAAKARYRTALFLPLLKDNAIVGVISIGRKQVQPFTDKQISLFRDFAAQASLPWRSPVASGSIARCRASWHMPTASLPWASSPRRLLMKSSSPLRRHAHTPLLHCGF
jgi:transcriptional regulator with GAF, ATPase, and Fis domain